MATQSKKTKLAAAVATAVVSLGLSAAANAVVVVGGDNGWEVSFDGNVNAFWVQSDNDAGWNALGFGTPSDEPGASAAEDISRVTSGFLPAFFSFNVKSPTINGMTGSARFSFAPTIQNSTNKTEVYAGGGLGNAGNGGIQGSSIDTREVLVNLDGGFGTFSYGRTLSIYGRQAILKDMTLFGVGVANQDGAGVTAGRIGRGYTYPNFNARFSYKTPNLGGLQGEIGLYDPSVEQTLGGTGLLDQTDTPRFEGEVSYTAALSGGSIQGWIDGLWQDIESTLPGAADNVTVQGWGVGAEAKFMGFGLTGYFYDGKGLGRSLQFLGGTRCNDGAGNLANGQECQAADNDGFYVQGTYNFTGKTKVGASYGESNQDGFGLGNTFASIADGLTATGDVELNMWTVGVYHDVSSWLKVIAEYSKAENDYGSVGGVGGGNSESNTFSIGSFFFW
ncbi:MAG: porin [Gammaproteobacteria bacterium]|nr:porin [Gammaproteobacteria bacterium]